MLSPHDASLPSHSFAYAVSGRDGAGFMQRLVGGSHLDGGYRGAPSNDEAEWPDLDERVRNVGEW